MKEDWGGELYCGINLSWNYGEGYVDISMPSYVHKQLTKYRHNILKRPQHYPHEPAAVKYGRKLQETPVKVESKILDKEVKLYVQHLVDSFLYYVRVAYMTILHTLNSIAVDSLKPTEHTMGYVEHLLNYMYTKPTTIVRYHISDMILKVHSDAS